MHPRQQPRLWDVPFKTFTYASRATVLRADAAAKLPVGSTASNSPAYHGT
jgi:hypothetical protein